MPSSGYFVKPFGVDGTRATVPDAVQSDGSVSYDQGYGVDYTLANTNPSYRYMEQDKFNQIFYDITSAIQNWQQHTIAPFITSSMNGGTPFSYSKYNMVLSGGIGYISLANTNTDTPPSAKWAAINLTGGAFFSGGVTTGAAANQVLATVTPDGYSLLDGVTVALTAGFNCPGACNFAIAGAANTAAKIWNGSAYVDPAASQFLLDETIFLSYNATHGVYVITDAPTLGTAAGKAVSDNSKTTVASVSGSFTAGHKLVAADTAGTVKDGGGPNTYQATPANPTATSSSTGVMMGLAGAITPNSSGVVMLIISGTILESANSTITFQIRYGTGSAPSNGSGLTGSTAGQAGTFTISGSVSLAFPFANNAIISGLTPGTPYWLDISLATNAGTATMTNVSISAYELN